MKAVVLVLVSTLAAAGSATAQSVVGSDHDLSGKPVSNEVCIYCHTPHQAPAAGGQDPLWNHQLSSVTSYGVYASPTMDASPTDIGSAVPGSATVSNLCMSCHDGTVAADTLYKPPSTGTDFLGGGESLGTDLTDDHPINFTYDAALAATDGELVTPDSSSSVDAAGRVRLFAGTVQCASCHDPHDDTNKKFLVMSNNGSALCVSCHTK